MPGAEEFAPVANQLQLIMLGGVPNGGSLALSWGEYTADPVPYDADLADFQTAVAEALYAMSGAGLSEDNLEVVVTLATNPDGEFMVLEFSFQEDLGNAPQPLFVVAEDPALTIGGDPTGPIQDILSPAGVAPNTVREAMMSVQTISGREVMLLPEGDRTRESYKIYTTALLRTLNEQTKLPADRVVIDGRLFEVRRVDPYPTETDLPHYRLLVVLVEQD